jgi:DNA repair exonuclease SbcCD ATPase subunit
MSRKDDVFIPALKDKKIPLLTLDNTWHRLFTQTDPSPEIVKLSEELNELLKKQGKLNNDTKDIKALKKRLMAEIVEQMDALSENPSKALEKKLNDNKRLIEECNQKLEEFGDDIYDIPKQINDVNYKLMLATMEVCYEQIQDNNAEIEEISNWVNEIRAELKKKVVRKQQKLKRNQNFYTYMHDIFGADVINIFDMKYNIEPLIESDTKDKSSDKKDEDKPDNQKI